jgi:hypothetical protein
MVVPPPTSTFGKNTSLPVSPAAQVVATIACAVPWAASIETARAVPSTWTNTCAFVGSNVRPASMKKLCWRTVVKLLPWNRLPARITAGLATAIDGTA